MTVTGNSHLLKFMGMFLKNLLIILRFTSIQRAVIFPINLVIKICYLIKKYNCFF